MVKLYISRSLKREIGIAKQSKNGNGHFTDVEGNIVEKDEATKKNKFIHLGLLGGWVFEIASDLTDKQISLISEVKLKFAAFGIPK